MNSSNMFKKELNDRLIENLPTNYSGNTTRVPEPS
jgi:hypothetical protein